MTGQATDSQIQVKGYVCDDLLRAYKKQSTPRFTCCHTSSDVENCKTPERRRLVSDAINFEHELYKHI